MAPIPILSSDQAAARAAVRRPHEANYYAFYSSRLGGIVTDPAWMTVPVDDHLVHRGDGVFETLKCVDGGIYLWHEHATRLQRSADSIGLRLPWSLDDLSAIVAQTVRAGGRRDGLIRVLASRGPGSLGVNPYDCPAPGLYVLVHAPLPPFMEAHPAGARVILSAQPPKPSFYAAIKSCNYLPNVLLKKEAVDAGVDFALCLDETGCLAEGATENAGIVTPDRVLRVPEPGRILAGTTMARAQELARRLVERGELRAVETARIPREQVAQAAELLIFGTTPDVTAAVELDGRPVGTGRPGPVWRALSDLLLADLRGNAALRLQAFGNSSDWNFQ